MYLPHRMFFQASVKRIAGLPLTDDRDHVATALSLHLQGMEVPSPRKEGEWFRIQTIIHMPGEEMLGRRAVCAVEGHVIPDKPRGASFGCKRCDFIFNGTPGPLR